MGSQQLISDLLREIESKGPTLPEDSPSKEHLIEREKRKHFVHHYSWAVPDLTVLNVIKEFLSKNDKILEVYAGTGLWASLIKNSGFDIITTDLDPYSPIRFTDVINLSSVEAVQLYKDCNVLFMCWPPYDCPSAGDCLKHFTGNKIIFIGEMVNGCTADHSFYYELETNFDITRIPMKRWFGIYDYLFLGERRT